MGFSPLTLVTVYVLKISTHENFSLNQSPSIYSQVIKDLGVYVSDTLSWHARISARMKKATSLLFAQKDLSHQLQAICKLGLYKSLLLSVLIHGFYCASLSRADMECLEKFQERVVQWITGSNVSSYISQQSLLNLLPLPMFLQFGDILLLVKLSNESNQLQKNENLGRRTGSFEPPNTWTERAKGELTLRSCRLINNLHELIDFSVTTGLKERILAIIRKFVNSGFCANDVCSWINVWDCGNWRYTRKMFSFQ